LNLTRRRIYCKESAWKLLQYRKVHPKCERATRHEK
jgi:hypothetical protein